MPITAVLEAAKNEVGYKEGKNNNNKFAKIAGHANNQPWCATFIRACFISGKEEKAIPDTAYCPHLESWARANNRVVPLREARKGDLVLFDFARNGRSDHVGLLINDFNSKRPEIVCTIEGNTSRQSETNGDGVAKKIRSIHLVRIIIRPKWSKT